jgi:hypothetical protein
MKIFQPIYISARIIGLINDSSTAVETNSSNLGVLFSPQQSTPLCYLCLEATKYLTSRINVLVIT